MPMKVYVCRLNEFTKFSTNSLDSKFEKIDDPLIRTVQFNSHNSILERFENRSEF